MPSYSDIRQGIIERISEKTGLSLEASEGLLILIQLGIWVVLIGVVIYCVHAVMRRRSRNP